MAGRGHVDVNERRLRPIYDCLDNGNNKKALQEAEKLLKKQKDFPCAKALKALALLRLGRHDDSTGLLHEVHGTSPTDDATLQAMSICYKEMNRMDLIADLYQKAHLAKPSSEEILSSLFMAHVRLCDYKKQQQAAMSLHRLCPGKNPYYFWAVMSIVMQAHYADKKLSQGMFLPLAERMTLKYVTDNKIEAEAEVLLYILILECMNKHKEILNVVQGPLGERLSSQLEYRENKCIELYDKLEWWPRLIATARHRLTTDPDNWLLYKMYLKSLFALIDNGWTPDNTSDNESDKLESDQKVDHTVEQAVAFLDEQDVTAAKEQRPIRGPSLARLELLSCLHARGKCESSPIAGDAQTLLKKYYAQFGEKSCCSSDLRAYCNLLSQETLQKMFYDLEKELDFCVTESGDDALPTDLKQLQRHLSIKQLQRMSGSHYSLSQEKKWDLLQSLLKHYSHGLKFGESLLSTDLQHSDPYLVMASHLLHDMWQDTGDYQYLLLAITSLEQGVKKSPSNFHMKLLLIKIYNTIGCFGPCPEIYDSMEVKHTQHDAIGYTLASHVGRLGHFSAACSLYETMLRFFTVNHRETTEYLISSYKYGSFTKIHEFVRFRERLQNSLQYAAATSERLLLDIILESNSHVKTEQMITYMEIDPEKDRTVLEDIRDNRDVTVMISWDSSDRLLTDESTELSFKEEKAWLNLRNLTIRALASGVLLGQECSNKSKSSANNIGNGESKRSMGEVLQDITSQITSHIKESQQYINTSEMAHLVVPSCSRLGVWLSLGMGDLLLPILNSVLYLYQLHEEGADNTDEKKETLIMETVAANICDKVTGCEGDLLSVVDGRPVFNAQLLERIVLISEAICHVIILIGACCRVVLPLKASLIKRSKKKKSPPVLPETFTNIQKMIQGVDKAVSLMLTKLKEGEDSILKTQLDQLSIKEEAGILKDQEDGVSILWGSIRSSYQQSLKEMTSLLQLKLQYLQQLKL